MTTLAWFAALVASVPLISVLYMLITRGGARLNLEVFTELPPTGFEMGGGFGNAMAGTFVMVGIAAAIAVPVGILAAVFLAELGPDSNWPTLRALPPRCSLACHRSWPGCLPTPWW